MKKLFIVSDFLYEEISGGAEINDYILSKELSNNTSVVRIKSEHLKLNDVLSVHNFFIISNFCLIKENILNCLIKNSNYVIYEHDHKYLHNRDPGKYKNFLAPKEDIVNRLFYKNAKAVFCQSKFHKLIMENNLQINNIINLSGNLWDDQTLNLLENLSKKNKKDVYSILYSKIPHKNTKDAIRYCEIKNCEYELISDNYYQNFLEKLSNNNSLIFLPKTPETLSRICVEARMCNMKVITNNLVGATQEEWFNLKGSELIEFMKNKRKEIVNILMETFT